MRKIAVILVNFHSELDLAESLKSLEESNVPAGFTREIVIVDNASREDNWGTVQALSQPYKDVQLIRSTENTGFTGGNNLGIEWARNWGADYFVLLNVDTKVEANFLVELVKVALEEENVGLICSKIYFYPGFEFHKDRYKENERGRVIWYGGGVIDWKNVVGSHKGIDKVDKEKGLGVVEETDFVTGCCMLIPKEVVDKVGELDEKLFFSWEDVDYSVRVKRAGYRILYAPKAVIWHKNAHTSGGAGGTIQDFYQTRNRLIFAFRYTPVKVAFLLFLLLLRNANWNRLKAIGSAVFAQLGA